jgi:Ca2+-binding EF-hand superfamily protein
MCAVEEQQAASESTPTSGEDPGLSNLAGMAEAYLEADAFFLSLDANGDGEVDQEELRAHLLSSGYSEATAASIFRTLDANGDGSLSRAEVREGFARYEDSYMRLALGLGHAEADAVFAAIDADGDGDITLEELTKHLESNGLEVSAAASIFQTLDKNSDGGLSQEELRVGWVEYAALRRALSPKVGRWGAGTGPGKVPKRWGRKRGAK